jgi:hypothetical protein
VIAGASRSSSARISRRPGATSALRVAVGDSETLLRTAAVKSINKLDCAVGVMLPLLLEGLKDRTDYVTVQTALEAIARLGEDVADAAAQIALDHPRDEDPGIVRVKSEGSILWEGAAGLSTIGRERFELIHFLSREDISIDPPQIYKEFTGPM